MSCAGHVIEFKLKRDTTRWGVMEDTVPNVYYVFIPPWVHARIVHPECQSPPPPDVSCMWTHSGNCLEKLAPHPSRLLTMPLPFCTCVGTSCCSGQHP